MRESCILLKETHYLCCLRKCMHTKRLYFDFEQEMWNVVKNLSCLQSVFAFKVFGNHFLSLEYFIFNLHVPNTNGTALFPQLFLLLACRRMTLVLTVVHIHNYMRLLLEEQDTDIHKKICLLASIMVEQALQRFQCWSCDISVGCDVSYT